MSGQEYNTSGRLSVRWGNEACRGGVGDCKHLGESSVRGNGITQRLVDVISQARTSFGCESESKRKAEGCERESERLR